MSNIFDVQEVVEKLPQAWETFEERKGEVKMQNKLKEVCVR